MGRTCEQLDASFAAGLAALKTVEPFLREFAKAAGAATGWTSSVMQDVETAMTGIGSVAARRKAVKQAIKNVDSFFSRYMQRVGGEIRDLAWGAWPGIQKAAH